MPCATNFILIGIYRSTTYSCNTSKLHPKDLHEVLRWAVGCKPEEEDVEEGYPPDGRYVNTLLTKRNIYLLPIVNRLCLNSELVHLHIEEVIKYIFVVKNNSSSQNTPEIPIQHLHWTVMHIVIHQATLISLNCNRNIIFQFFLHYKIGFIDEIRIHFMSAPRICDQY